MRIKRTILAALLAALAVPAMAHADEYGNSSEGEQEPSWDAAVCELQYWPENGTEEPYGPSQAPENGDQEVMWTIEAPMLAADEFMFQGVVEYGGNTWTWYSENVLPGDGLSELNAGGRHVGEGGYVMDGEGYIALASPDWDEPVGTVVQTPFGLGRVYDYCGSGAYDVYVAW